MLPVKQVWFSLPLLPCGWRFYRPAIFSEIDLENVIHNVVALILPGAVGELGLRLLFLNDLYHLCIRIPECFAWSLITLM